MIRWALHSPQRAVAVLLGVLLAVAILFGLGVGNLIGKLPQPVAKQSSSAEPTQTQTTATGGPTGSIQDATAAREAAKGFVTAWLATSADKAAWSAKMAPYATKRLLDLSVLTDPTSVPTTTLKAATTTSSTPTIATVDVDLADGKTLTVTTLQVQGVWRADDMRPAGT